MYPVTGNWPGNDEKKRTALNDDIRRVAHDKGGLTVLGRRPRFTGH